MLQRRPPSQYGPGVDPDDRIGFVTAGQVVCSHHLTDPFLRDWVEDHATSTTCSLCDRTSATPIAADLGDLAVLIQDGLTRDWADQTEEVPWGMGYDGAMTTPELLELEDVTDDQELMSVLSDALPDYGWVQRDFFVLSPHERLTSGWAGFTNLIKHQSRFFFSVREGDPTDHDDVSPLDILSELAGAAADAGLLDDWPVGTVIFRARLHRRDESAAHSWELAALPTELADRAAANRMSPAGVPMFYGASTAAAARDEARSVDPRATDKVVTVGEFEACRPLRILNLSHGVDVPSQFDRDRGHLRPALAFLSAFVTDVAQPVTRDGREHVDYVPTQVVCEYLRSVHRFHDGQPVDGIAYPSTRTPGATDVVLFVSNGDVEDADGTRPQLPDHLRFYGPLSARSGAVLRLRSLA